MSGPTPLQERAIQAHVLVQLLEEAIADLVDVEVMDEVKAREADHKAKLRDLAQSIT